MSPEEQELLSTLAQIANLNLAVVISLLVQKSTYPVRRVSSQRLQITRGVILCLVMNFVCFTWFAVFQGGTFLIQAKYTLVKSLPGGLVDQVQLSANRAMAWRFMPVWAVTISNHVLMLQYLKILLSDGIVVWRAWILLQHDNICRLALGCLMVANTAVNIADCIWEDVHVQTDIIALGRPSALDWVSNMLSLLLNACATFLITLKARSQHRMMYDASLHKKTRAQHIMLLLVESGAIYCAMQAVYEVLILLQVYSTVLRFNLIFLEAMNIITNIIDIILMPHLLLKSLIKLWTFTKTQFSLTLTLRFDKKDRTEHEVNVLDPLLSFGRVKN
ncbi:hypothetical protein EV360DRAFT_72738 [Lentinula raphanica]|nr:hypothetical protein EV360DRAFT_72738 [Lentinula raphanica]